MAAKAGGNSPSSRTGTPASGPLSHSPRSRPNTLTSWWRPPWRCQSRSTPSWRKPTPRSARVERTFSGFEYEPTRCMPSSANARCATIAFDSRFAPVPQKSRPNHVPTTQRRSRIESSESPVMPAGPCCRWTTSRSRRSPRARSSSRRSMYCSGSSTRVYGPHENQRVTSGSPASASRAGASSAHGGRRVSVGPCRAMLALLYDIHGNLPALEAVLDDAAGRGVERWLLGGDIAPFGAWPAATVARLRELERATWIRGNTERWLGERIPAEEPMAAAVEAARDDLGDAIADDLAALPENARLDADTMAWHGSPVSDMRSFMPEPGDDEAELLARVPHPPLVFGHTHLQFRRPAARDGIELLNPGSVGIPLDGDHRAAYALIAPDGSVDLRRVEYDWQGSADALRERYGDAEWVGIVTGRIERARIAPE